VLNSFQGVVGHCCQGSFFCFKSVAKCCVFRDFLANHFFRGGQAFLVMPASPLFRPISRSFFSYSRTLTKAFSPLLYSLVLERGFVLLFFGFFQRADRVLLMMEMGLLLCLRPPTRLLPPFFILWLCSLGGFSFPRVVAEKTRSVNPPFRPSMEELFSLPCP